MESERNEKLNSQCLWTSEPGARLEKKEKKRADLKYYCFFFLQLINALQRLETCKSAVIENQQQENHKRLENKEIRGEKCRTKNTDFKVVLSQNCPFITTQDFMDLYKLPTILKDREFSLSIVIIIVIVLFPVHSGVYSFLSGPRPET